MKNKAIRKYILIANLLLLFAVFAFVIHHSSSAVADNQQVSTNSNNPNNINTSDPLDQLSSAQIAVQVARMTGIYESTSVSNLADSENAAVNVTQSDSQVVAAPVVIASNNAKSKEDIVKYVTKPGDTVSSLAVRFGVTSNSIMWSNSLNGNSLSTGLTLNIPPISGIVYTVKPGDTPTSLAQRYNVDANQIASFNDAENGFTTNEQIVIPNATAPAISTTSTSLASYNNYTFGYGPVYGANGYDFGYCTWWAAQRRIAIGEPIPSNLGNASTWYGLSQSAGIPTGTAPEKYAVIWFGYYANHVGFVESVNSDGSVVISEMNRNGWDVEDTRTLSPSEAASYKYIY